MTSVHFSDSGSGSPPEPIPAALEEAQGASDLLKVPLHQPSGAGLMHREPPSPRTYSHGILEAIEDLHNQPDVGTLLSAVADYGTSIIPADGIAIFKRTAGGWRPAAARAVYDESDVIRVERPSNCSPQKVVFSRYTAVTTSATTSVGASSLFPAACEPGGHPRSQVKDAQPHSSYHAQRARPRHPGNIFG